MPNECYICGKRKHVGGSITRRGMPKKKKGIGTHVVSNVKRTFSPNLQPARVRVGSVVKKIKVCAACLRSGRVTKA